MLRCHAREHARAAHFLAKPQVVHLVYLGSRKDSISLFEYSGLARYSARRRRVIARYHNDAHTCRAGFFHRAAHLCAETIFEPKERDERKSLDVRRRDKFRGASTLRERNNAESVARHFEKRLLEPFSLCGGERLAHARATHMTREREDNLGRAGDSNCTWTFPTDNGVILQIRIERYLFRKRRSFFERFAIHAELGGKYCHRGLGGISRHTP